MLKDYIKVIEYTDAGAEHIHMAFRGEFIAKLLLSTFWNEIHKSPIVDIRGVKQGSQHKRRVANYLAKYMSKELSRRYSWSWGWVYKGFCHTWKKAVSLCWQYSIYQGDNSCFGTLLKFWKLHVRILSPPGPFLDFLQLNYQLLLKKKRSPAKVEPVSAPTPPVMAAAATP